MGSEVVQSTMHFLKEDSQSTMHFLKEDSSFREEKPYAFQYKLSSDDIRQSNMEMQEVKSVKIKDMRGFERKFSLEANGFTILRFDSKLQYQEFYDAEKLKVYFTELEDLLKLHLGANQVKVFRHGVRWLLNSRNYFNSQNGSSESVTPISPSPQVKPTATNSQHLLLTLVGIGFFRVCVKLLIRVQILPRKRHWKKSDGSTARRHRV